MLFLSNDDLTDPAANLALEEYCLLHLDPEETYLLFYVNEPSVIIGKHQNTLEEIDSEFIRERGIHVVRRISGGGAVYHDLGNLNFSVITRYTPQRFNNYREFTGPVVAALRSLGVPAETTGRNDVVVAGRKVSGNAQVVRGSRMFSHGTLLLDSNLDDVVRALRPRAGKFESKGIPSIRSRVANIAEYLDAPLSMAEFRAALLAHLFPGQSPPPTQPLTEAQRAEVRALADAKYRTWEWNYGESPPFNVQRARRFPIGEIDVRIQVEDGFVKSVRFTGDYFSEHEIDGLEHSLEGVRYEPGELSAALAHAGAERYFVGVGVPELVGLMY